MSFLITPLLNTHVSLTASEFIGAIVCLFSWIAMVLVILYSRTKTGSRRPLESKERLSAKEIVQFNSWYWTLSIYYIAFYSGLFMLITISK